MAPEVKSKLTTIISTLGVAGGVIALIFAGGGFYSQTNDTNRIAVPALRTELHQHITKEELFKEDVVDVLNEIKIEMKVNKQAFDDLKETVKVENKKTINAIKEQ